MEDPSINQGWFMGSSKNASLSSKSTCDTSCFGDLRKIDKLHAAKAD
jgi:hypothetical protein